MIRSFFIILFLSLIVGCSGSLPKEYSLSDKQCVIYPDYNGVTFPSNISTISFRVDSSADSYAIGVVVDGKTTYSARSNNGCFAIPSSVWRKICLHSSFSIDVYTLNDNKWSSYSPIVNYISSSTIDSYLTYRLIPPGYELWNDMGIYQRDLSSFKETPIITNTQTGGGCVNCHVYGANTVENSMFHFRGEGGGTIIRQGDQVKKVNFNSSNDLISEGTYPAWHPSGDFIAYSVNDISQYFHINGRTGVEVSDSKSDIIIYDLKNDKIIKDTLLFNTPILETFPEWSPDGKTLYFTAAESGSHDTALDSIRYNLYSVDFDIDSRSFSNVKLLIDAASISRSISFAKATYDGGYIVATIANYGNFTIWHNEADLIVYDLNSGSWRYADEINSDFTESYHSFSSSGDWMVFSSRRDDGLYTRPYFTQFNPESGEFTKPFMLPQHRADFYEDLFYSYNIPVFTYNKYKKRRKLLDVIDL